MDYIPLKAGTSNGDTEVEDLLITFCATKEVRHLKCMTL